MTGLSRSQVRELDRRAIEEFGVPSLVLMENAGRGAAQTLFALGVHGPVLIACGKGNNAGDGLVMARHLVHWEVDVKVVLFAAPEELTTDAGVNWRIVVRDGIPLEIAPAVEEARLAADLACSEWVVDALYGTGLQGAVRPPLDRVIAAINASPAHVFAVDLPSGLDADTGQPLGATVRAEHTATFVAPKKGFAQPASAAWTGRVHVVDIGAPAALVRQVLHEANRS